MAAAFKKDPTKEDPADPLVRQQQGDKKLRDQYRYWKRVWFPPSWLTFLLLGLPADEKERCVMCACSLVSAL